MRRLLLVCAVLALASEMLLASGELLTNPGINATVQVGPPALYYPEFVGWTITTDPCSFSPCTILPYVPGGVYTPYAGYPAAFADRLNPDASDHGLIGAAFEGHYPFEITGPVDVEISQIVPGIAGKRYSFSGWAHFEGGYAGGVEFLDLLSPNQRNQDAQLANPGVPVAALTDTYFSLEFLDGIGSVLPGSIPFYELHDDGGQNNDNEFDGRDWMQHILTAVAPAGTVSVRVRAGMRDGEFNVDMPHQNVFLDDFSLSIPEPGSLALGLLSLAFLGGVRRTR